MTVKKKRWNQNWREFENKMSILTDLHPLKKSTCMCSAFGRKRCIICKSEWAILPAKTSRRPWRQKSLCQPNIRGRRSPCRKKTLSFLTNGYLSLNGSHKKLNQIKNKRIAVSETRMNLLFHSVCRIFFRCLNFFQWFEENSQFYSTGLLSQQWLSLSCHLDLEMVVVLDDDR